MSDTCTCGCNVMPAVSDTTTQSSGCACGCGTPADLSREEEIAQLRRVRAAADERLEELGAG